MVKNDKWKDYKEEPSSYSDSWEDTIKLNEIKLQKQKE